MRFLNEATLLEEHQPIEKNPVFIPFGRDISEI